MTTYFVKVNLFLVPDQVEKDESMAIDPQYNVVVNFPLPLIDWDEQEVNDLDILTKPVEACTKEWIDGKVARLKQKGVILTYEGLKKAKWNRQWVSCFPIRRYFKIPSNY